ncbi:unnamed protein product [Adineta ricciae]|uniref:Uncharacterized protein n=1 Tax=Adineta ricciae TaxID=249248 RepID=A0A815PS62_ADIRI|nr:unnamed protein product [Adineta ricciae]CAF1453147.1 unnamed protein product [Adineta ricciae]
MMKIFFAVFITILLPMMSDARCSYGCSCSDDSPCENYCENNICQNAIPLGQKCSSYYFHPRQCGIVSYCDPDSDYTCQLQKNYGASCTYDYSCLSGNCDYASKTCQSKSFNFLYPIVIPAVAVFFIIIIIIISVSIRRQRMRALALYRAPYVVLPAGTPYSYQNPYMVAEVPPPAYPGATPAPKPYQSA